MKYSEALKKVGSLFHFPLVSNRLRKNIALGHIKFFKVEEFLKWIIACC